MSLTCKDILNPIEVEMNISAFEPTNMEELGTPRWFESHSRLQKLNQQAIIEAGNMKEEMVKEMLISYGKVPILVHEVICISVWREKILSDLLNCGSEISNSFMIYLIMYHEDTAVNLLETILFHSDGCESLEDSAVDLIDYCAFAIALLLGDSFDNFSEIIKQPHTEMVKKIESNMNEGTESFSLETRRQLLELRFDIGIRSISIITFLSDYLSKLPLSATSRMYITNDVPILFVNLLEKQPWIKKDPTGQKLKYIDNKWQPFIGDGHHGLSRVEGNVWICLRQLLLDPRCPVHYDINDYRQSQLLKIQKHLTDNVIDQIAPLMELRYWLSQLAMSNLPPPSKRPVILEVLPQIRQTLLNKSNKEWKQLIVAQKDILKSCQKQKEDIAKSLMDAYDMNNLDSLCPQNQICIGCGEPANKRCSRCKTYWYCGKECQIKTWNDHKLTCNRITETAQKAAT